MEKMEIRIGGRGSALWKWCYIPKTAMSAMSYKRYIDLVHGNDSCLTSHFRADLGIVGSIWMILLKSTVSMHDGRLTRAASTRNFRNILATLCFALT